jgi:hypothetical protein
VPHVLSAYSVLDTFYRRLRNVGLHAYTVYLHHRLVAADREPPVKPSLVFVNTHYATEPSRPVPVNRVNVGGVHLKRPDPLPTVSVHSTNACVTFRSVSSADSEPYDSSADSGVFRERGTRAHPEERGRSRLKRVNRTDFCVRHFVTYA